VGVLAEVRGDESGDEDEVRKPASVFPVSSVPVPSRGWRRSWTRSAELKRSMKICVDKCTFNSEVIGQVRCTSEFMTLRLKRRKNSLAGPSEWKQV
jgi:hypothetical protein